MKTIDEHARDTLTELLGREPTKQELGNMHTDTWVRGEAIKRSQEDMSVNVEMLQSKTDLITKIQ